MNKLKFIKQINNIKFFTYRPSVLHLYYPCYFDNDRPPYFSRFIHRIRMIRELYKSHYKIIYMMVDDVIVGHLVVGYGGCRIKMSTKNDIVIGPIWIIPNQRCQGYASKGIYFILNELNIEYEYAYEYIDKNNLSSIQTVKKNGFEFFAECSEYGLFREIRPKKSGKFNVYRKKCDSIK